MEIIFVTMDSLINRNCSFYVNKNSLINIHNTRILSHPLSLKRHMI
ncbi:hypothetical protein FORC30_p009 (plasmid) [Salmonella enterica]|nr:hypothetical protein FORC30_p009 [Salmonella enterica]